MIQAHGENLVHTRPYARAEINCSGPPSVSSPFSDTLMAMGTNIQENNTLDLLDQQPQPWGTDTSPSQWSTTAAGGGGSYFGWNANHQSKENTGEIGAYQRINANSKSFPPSNST